MFDNIVPSDSTSDDAFRSLDDRSDWSAVLDASREQPVVVFKHSAICPTSAKANDEMVDLSDDVPVYRVVVQESRKISDAIAEELDIKHESPQAIVLEDGSPIFDASHHRVKADTVRSALENGTA